MNAAKMTLVSTVVAAVFGLALSFGASPAKAHCRGKHLDDDGTTCIHVDQDQKSQTFMVELIEGDTDDAIITGTDCIGSSERKQVTEAIFPPHSLAPGGCNSITLDTEPNLHLCQLNINHANRPDMSVTMFFTSGQGVVGGVLCPDDVYKGEFDADFDGDVCTGEEEGATCVTIDLSGLTLEKIHQPGKGTSAGGESFSVGTIVWTPVE